MKNLLLVTASLVALSATAPAFGADLAEQPVYTRAAPPRVAAALYDWSGLYVGFNGGWGSGHNSWDATGVAAEGSHDASGVTLGGQIGYRWQMGQVVFGVEGQGNVADFRGSNVSLAFPTDTISTKTDAFGLIAGQIGYAVNNVLLYAKGGAAVTSNTYQISRAAPTTPTPGGQPTQPTGGQSFSADDTRWGAAVGAGAEVGFAPNWSLGIEYDHLFMQPAKVTFTTAGGVLATDRISQDIDVVTARITYRFGGPLVVLP
ncbi:outer membrane protein [Bradyrhizobium sp. BWA-3-5]|uniref:outer membrane protein n=1 Tax=Bradyrhizobium sp. BWA-3-5 TaxID=3080013 RepID=UPI00293F30C1|nr:outer membrane beta-barrel protein [Bradyrhizobium sp. BWA-3-5]WOH63849.1 outer membrane beta-barrel protein [Bradyrhizobium sp. BWA-3-5]